MLRYVPGAMSRPTSFVPLPNESDATGVWGATASTAGGTLHCGHRHPAERRRTAIIQTEYPHVKRCTVGGYPKEHFPFNDICDGSRGELRAWIQNADKFPMFIKLKRGRVPLEAVGAPAACLPLRPTSPFELAVIESAQISRPLPAVS